MNFFKSYLIAYLFAVGIPLGSLALILIHGLTGGAWGRALRPVLVPAARTVPLFAALFIPLAIGLPHVYEWARPEAAHDAILQSKAFYLNVPFFLIRAAVYFAVWTALAFTLTKWTAEYDRTHDETLVGRIQLGSGIGLVLFGTTGTFAAFDWAMSLEPHWYSTIYGLLFLVGATLQTLALATMILSKRGPKNDEVTIGHFHDFGNLMLAFVMLWAYMSFSQFLLIWSANIPEETVYYVRRSTPAWIAVGAGLMLFHFAVPFVLLLMKFVKRNLSALPKLAAAIFLVHAVDTLWLVNPTFGGWVVHPLDVILIAVVLGLWYSTFRWLNERSERNAS